MSDADAPAKDPAPKGAATHEARAPERRADVVLLGPPTNDGAGLHVIRAREERIEAGELRALQEGRPITGEIVTLEPRKDNPRVCDVKDSYTPPARSAPPALGHKGPANVTTNAYRDGWDEVFGTKKPN